MRRRAYLAGASATGLALTAGCVTAALEDYLEEATTFSASPATVDDEVASDAGYTHQETTSIEESEEFAGETVEVTNYLTEYTRSVDVPGLGELEAGVFSVITSPRVSVADQQFNPLAEMDSEQIVELVQDQYDGLSIDRLLGKRAVSGLGQSVSVETHEGSATLLSDAELDILLDIAQPDHGGDHFVIVGVYPADLPDEDERVDAMIGGLEHDD
ncbi:DUF6517 family protein [Natrononativus amylolyticus]|uniref:DUF6517 family protein n=1 Tax=Natrononativus amylolyticus TaxID=2963434 RepID=UPI0020CFDFD3|nr:DUF6517 family protein [Natrononativus amylolyticus]